MDYRSGSTSRVFVIRFDDNDDFLVELTNLIKKENIRNAWFQIIGGVKEIDCVIGPKKPVMPPDPVWQEVRDARETLGSGSIFWDENNEPKIHLHAAMGHHGDTVTGCLRKGSKTYLVLEVILYEITGFEATRPWSDEKGFNILTFS
ncbi:MAG: DNA-binding protein [Desulfobulbaceae bacterium]|nr:DNA-binding protein [Desulfobulbaceae bacterium]